jgi:hypothetical protein
MLHAIAILVGAFFIGYIAALCTVTAKVSLNLPKCVSALTDNELVQLVDAGREAARVMEARHPH